MRTLTGVKSHRAAPVKPSAPASTSQVLAVLQKTLAKSVAPAERAKVAGLLEHPALKDAHVSFVQSGDSASEIIGYDRLQITPKGAKYSLVVSLDHVEA